MFGLRKTLSSLFTRHRVDEAWFDHLEESLIKADVGVSTSEVGATGAWSVVTDAQARPPRDKGIKIEDSGDGGSKLAEYLAEKRLV